MYAVMSKAAGQEKNDRNATDLGQEKRHFAARRDRDAIGRQKQVC